VHPGHKLTGPKEEEEEKKNHSRLHVSLHAASKSPTLCCVFVLNISVHRKYMTQFKLKTADIGETESDYQLYSIARNAVH
jgi:hypothetical protein